ncbi:methylenetetrahydrofolate reductase [Gayadomonas joobiniege]|uniref:methylenetetrahydrofolate reductase n=1 Tax=Gayadomonas joobiniege TaxID=1234606 RepID=UPI0003710F70|nr:methylenetetrahydrofolate reductase [Gayadomonas joobiniege]
MNISFEIVPRTAAATEQQMQFIAEQLPFVNTINVPDLLRLPIRSWDGVDYVDSNKYSYIPHIRSIDFDMKSNRLQQIIEEKELDKILIVTGDPPPDRSFRVYPTGVVELVRKIRQDFPEIEIFCGFDPYRSGVQQEKEYINKKFDAGCDAILSQPFFDIRLMDVYADFLPADKVYWGVSPVITDKSKAYWESVNKVVFPKSFDASYEWNINFATEVLKHCQKTGSHCYFMPIRIDLERYFLPIKQSLSL